MLIDTIGKIFQTIMTLEEYHSKIATIGFEERPDYITGHEPHLDSFIDYPSIDGPLKLHLCKMIICRSFPTTGGIFWPKDPTWFIQNFLSEFERDLSRPWLTNTIRQAISMIIKDNAFEDYTIATTFMFGIIEFYIKYLLGWRPLQYNFFDKEHNVFREMQLGPAINKLKKQDSRLAEDLNKIDKFNIARIKNLCIIENGWQRVRLADRLTLARNSMLHGEHHSFSDKGKLLIMLYILFHLHALPPALRSIPQDKYGGK